MSPLPVHVDVVRTTAPLTEALELVLQRVGIAVRPGSQLEQFLLETLRLDYDRRAVFRPEASLDVPRRYGTGFGVLELAEHLAALSDNPEFSRLIPHLSLLGSTTSTLNLPSAQTDQAANRLFELFVACWVMHRGHDTVLETPRGRPNPDVLTTLPARRWGFACKTIHSLHPEALFGNLEKGVEQILRSDAEVGVVVVNLKNVLRHGRYWHRVPEADTPDGAHAWSVFPNPQEPYDLLVSEINGIWNDLAAHVGEATLRSLLSSNRVLPGVLCWAHTAAGVVHEGTARACAVRCFLFAQVAPLLDWQKQTLDRVKADATRFRAPSFLQGAA